MPSALATRVVTGIALVAGVLAALFLLPPAGWGVVVLAIVVAAADEWARLAGFRGLLRLAPSANSLPFSSAAMS